MPRHTARDVLLCHDHQPRVSVIVAAAGLDPVFRPDADGTLFATVPEPAVKQIDIDDYLEPPTFRWSKRDFRIREAVLRFSENTEPS